MSTTRANYNKMEKSFNDLRDYYIEEKFNDMNNKYDELKATLSNDTIEKFKGILNKEISKITDKLEGKFYQVCQEKSFFQEQIRELKKKKKKKKNRTEPLQLLVKKQSSTVEDFP